MLARPVRPGPGPVELVPQPDVHPLWDRSWRRQLAVAGPVLDEVVAQLVGREHRTDRVVQVLDLAVRADLGAGPEVAAALQLRVDGATAAVDAVLTDPRARRRGHADALLAAALGHAEAAGCDLVVLDAAELGLAPALVRPAGLPGRRRGRSTSSGR